MKNVRFYVCAICGNTMFSISEVDTSCCGKTLTALNVSAKTETHPMTIEEVEDDYFIKINHEMTKTHYISFVAFVSYDRILFVKLYPEQNAELRIPKMCGDTLYAYCSEHGLWEQKI